MNIPIYSSLGPFAVDVNNTVSMETHFTPLNFHQHLFDGTHFKSEHPEKWSNFKEKKGRELRPQTEWKNTLRSVQLTEQIWSHI